MRMLSILQNSAYQGDNADRSTAFFLSWPWALIGISLEARFALQATRVVVTALIIRLPAAFLAGSDRVPGAQKRFF